MKKKSYLHALDCDIIIDRHKTKQTSPQNQQAIHSALNGGIPCWENYKIVQSILPIFSMAYTFLIFLQVCFRGLWNLAHVDLNHRYICSQAFPSRSIHPNLHQESVVPAGVCRESLTPVWSQEHFLLVPSPLWIHWEHHRSPCYAASIILMCRIELYFEFPASSILSFQKLRQM